MKRLSLISCLAILSPLFGCLDAEAQRYRYMDSSGGIHFVESWKEVPREYRQQIAPATPTPVLDDRAKREVQRTRQREAKKQQQKIDKKRRALEQERKALEKERRKGTGKGLTASGSGPDSSREGEIELIR